MYVDYIKKKKLKLKNGKHNLEKLITYSSLDFRQWFIGSFNIVISRSRTQVLFVNLIS